MESKQLKEKGEVDYDFRQDILFFKTMEREYTKSFDTDNITIDIDKEGLLVGIQIFEASKFLNVDKKDLLIISQWEFIANVYGGNRIDIRLTFQVKIRNKIIEKNPIILQQINENLPDSQLVCEAVV